MKQKILFVEDEHDLGNVVKQYLEVMDFEIDWCTNGKMALNTFREKSHQYNILIVDIQLPGMDGFELAERIGRLDNNVPFLFLTARNEKKDRLRGLNLGADDYISKPFDIDELVLRIRNILRRHHPVERNRVPAGTAVCGDTVLYKDQFKICIADDKTITLTQREVELLEYLFLHKNKVLKREEILEELWGKNDYFLGRSLDVFISRLRKHLHSSSKIAINSVYGVGFIFEVEE
ncbi:MAG: response regulator transcription factor [Bacteroidetes bacterium]|nr:response regulator transcription factor [Bacteroidota bacterium]